MSLSEKLQDLHGEVSAAIERAVAEMRQELAARLRSGNEELVRRLEEFSPRVPASLFHHDAFALAEQGLRAEARSGSLAGLRDDLAALDRERTQGDILRALLRTACHHASRSALFLTRADGIQGWGSEGFGDAASALQATLLSAAPGGSWERLAGGHGPVALNAAEAADLCSRLEVPLPRRAVLVPLVLRDRVAAALYADQLDEGDLALEALQILSYVAAQSIETLPFRERGATPTLASDGGGAKPALGFWPPAGHAAPAPPPAEPEPAAAPIPPEAQPRWVAEPEPYLEPVEPADEPVELEVEEESPVSTQQATVPPEIRAERLYPRPVEEAEPPSPPLPSYPPYPQVDAAAPVESQNATVLMPRPAFIEPEPPPLPPPAAPEPPPVLRAPIPSAYDEAAPAPAGTGTVEVRPPTDVDGPGWAFNTTRVAMAPGEDAVHDEARRLARLLVSEIKLYNEEQVEEGRRNRDIYERLKEDIDRSRQMYEERVDERIRLTTDYFYQELVRILAAGDSKSLGI